MAATYALISDRIPNGATVYANAVGEDDEPVQSVMTDGAAFFEGLREYADYVAHATIGTADVDGAGTTKVQVTFATGGGSDAATGVPEGGDTGQVLVKSSDSDGDAEWTTLPPSVGAVLYDSDAEEYPVREDGPSKIWIGPVAPQIGGAGGALPLVDVWVPTVEPE